MFNAAQGSVGFFFWGGAVEFGDFVFWKCPPELTLNSIDDTPIDQNKGDLDRLVESPVKPVRLGVQKNPYHKYYYSFFQGFFAIVVRYADAS